MRSTPNYSTLAALGTCLLFANWSASAPPFSLPRLSSSALILLCAGSGMLNFCYSADALAAPVCLPNTRAHAHTHTHIHTHIHNTHTHTHPHTQTHTHTHTQTHTHTHKTTHTHTHMHTHTNTHTRTHTHTHTHTQTHTHILTHTCTHMHTHAGDVGGIAKYRHTQGKGARELSRSHAACAPGRCQRSH